MKMNTVVAQSGGPTTVINNSIKGAVDLLLSSDRIGTIFGARMGVLGILYENLLDISKQQEELINQMGKTPSAGMLGSCRYKVKSDEDIRRIIEVFKMHNIGYFLYCGGGDSMDTAEEIHIAAREEGLNLIVTGIPKTIDNDLGGPLKDDGTFDICDHNPGYGCVARNTAINVLEANEENKASYTSDPVLVIGLMGRNAGFIPAAARLADPLRKIPLLIVIPENMKGEPEDNLKFINQSINEKLEKFKRCIVVIGEGVKLGASAASKDSFGHIQFSSSGVSVEQILTNYLNGLDRIDKKTRLIVRGNARCEKPGTRQRREMAYVSKVDLIESYNLGKCAAKIALDGNNGYMSTIERIPGVSYKVVYNKILLKNVAGFERKFTEEWILKDELDVSDDFIRWAMPLIGSKLPEFNGFEEIYAEKKCERYIPFLYRD